VDRCSVQDGEVRVRSWFSWRLAIGSVVLGLVFAGLLFTLTGKPLTLSGLDLFFVVMTVISLAFNLWQLFRDKYKYTPLRDSMIGLFNDLKSRQLRAYQRQLLITTEAGMELSLDAVRLEFYDYLQETNQGLEQLREHVVAAIHTLDEDASTQQVFRASEFGLTDQEKTLRDEWTKRSSWNGPSEPQAASESGADSIAPAPEEVQ
jgi:hypothetical protein